MNPSKISSILSLFASLIILTVSFFQWWDITYNGKMITRKWIKFCFAVCIFLVLISLILIIKY